MIRGLGQYKRGGGFDRALMLTIWSGDAVDIERVGDGLSTHVPTPGLSILGGIQPALLKLLDGDDGLSGRWLYSAYPDIDPDYESIHPVGQERAQWKQLLTDIIKWRTTARTTTLREDERAFFIKLNRRMQQVRREDNGIVRHWAAKGSAHFLRLALTLAEARQPGAGAIGMNQLEQAESLVDYFLSQVRDLPVRQDNLMVAPYLRGQDEAVDKLEAFVRRKPELRATRRDIQMAHVAGARTPDEIDRLIQRYEETHPGCVDDGIVYAPGEVPE